MHDQAIKEMRSRVTTLRDKAKKNRADAAFSEQQAAESHAAARACDETADQYERIIGQFDDVRRDVLAEF
jgi:hypothetical protein